MQNVKMGFSTWDNETFHHLYMQNADRQTHRKYEYVSKDDLVRVLNLVFGSYSALFSTTIIQPRARPL